MFCGFTDLGQVAKELEEGAHRRVLVAVGRRAAVCVAAVLYFDDQNDYKRNYDDHGTAGRNYDDHGAAGRNYDDKGAAENNSDYHSAADRNSEYQRRCWS